MIESSAESDRFPRSVVETLAKRAGNICSNPDCRAPTCGPAEEPLRSVNVGEAAHIYGARSGSARYRVEMASAERSDITNGIWLCRNCHRQVDSDASAFPADMLFVWRRTHEEELAASIGKANPAVRRQVHSRMPAFDEMSYLAQQIIIDKPYAWEYRLTAELLRSGLEPLLWRWRALRERLYSKPGPDVSQDEVLSWYKERLHNLSPQMAAISTLVNKELQIAWGAPGEPGSELAISRTCELIVEAATRLVQWEEDVRFANLPNEFNECQNLLSGIGGRALEVIFLAPQRFAEIFSVERPTGTHEINLVFDLPEKWPEKISRSFEEAIKRARKRIFGGCGG